MYCGSGLELAIANQIVQLMGGVIDVATAAGVGTLLTFTVPFIIASANNGTLNRSSLSLHPFSFTFSSPLVIYG